MSIIKQPLLFVGSKGEMKLAVVFDKEAKLSLIDGSFITDLATPVRLGINRLVNKNGRQNEITTRVLLEFYCDGRWLSDEFFVVSNFGNKVLIGSPTIRKWRIKPYFEYDTDIVKPKVAKMQLV